MDTADVLKAILGIVTGAIGTYLGLYWKIKKELVAQYDRDLRAERVKHYNDLWEATELLAKYSPPEPITRLALEQLSKSLREWYFRGGGMFLSDRARDNYFLLQDSIVEALTRTVAKEPDAFPLPEDVKAIRRHSSRLRTVITMDLGTRKKPLLEDSHEA